MHTSPTIEPMERIGLTTDFKLFIRLPEVIGSIHVLRDIGTNINLNADGWIAQLINSKTKVKWVLMMILFNLQNFLVRRELSSEVLKSLGVIKRLRGLSGTGTRNDSESLGIFPRANEPRIGHLPVQMSRELPQTNLNREKAP